MRGIVGLGPNRVNKYTFGKNTQGISNYINKIFKKDFKSVVIAYDCRNDSEFLAQKVAESINIPVIGIGAGNGVDGQVLVLHDMLGMIQEFNPRFLRRYHNLHQEILKACSNFKKDVKSQDFPNKKEQY